MRVEFQYSKVLHYVLVEHEIRTSSPEKFYCSWNCIVSNKACNGREPSKMSDVIVPRRIVHFFSKFVHEAFFF